MQVPIVGRMGMEDLAPFLEQLTALSSRRTISLALLRAPPSNTVAAARLAKARLMPIASHVHALPIALDVYILVHAYLVF